MSALERALVDLGRRVEWPPEPDLAPRVVAELRAAIPLRARRRRRTVLLAAAVIVALSGGLMAVPPIRAAVVRLFTLPGVEIRIEETTPPSSGSPQTSPGSTTPIPLLGTPVTLEEAQAEAPFRVPLAATLGEVQAVYLDGSGERAIVTLAYPDGVLLSSFRPRPDEELMRKLVDEGVGVLQLQVHGEPAYWIPGEHTLLLIDEEGEIIEDRSRTAGSSLLWTRGDVTLRLEGDMSRVEAVRIARSVS